MPCYLLSKSPWLNPIEPKWAHGKRRVVEPARLLTADELIDRVCAAFDCDLEPRLAIHPSEGHSPVLTAVQNSRYGLASSPGAGAARCVRPATMCKSTPCGRLLRGVR